MVEDIEIERILVALDSALRGDALLEAAARLAAIADAELTALFVEDAELLQLAALPFARELDRTSAALRELVPDSLERELQAQARRLHRCVEGLGERHGIRANLRVLRGELATAALAEAAERDLLFFGAGAQVRVSRRAVQRFDVPGDAPVCVYSDDTATARRALHLAGAWARQWGRRLRILAPPDDKTLTAVRTAGATNAEVVVLPETGEAALRAILARHKNALLVLPRSLDVARLRRGGVLDAVSCPVVMVS